MDIIFNVDDKIKYALVKLPCGWEMLKYMPERTHRGKTVKEGWRAMNSGRGCYPHNISHAISLMTDDIVANLKGKMDFRQFNSFLRSYLRTIDTEVLDPELRKVIDQYEKDRKKNAPEEPV